MVLSSYSLDHDPDLRWVLATRGRLEVLLEAGLHLADRTGRATFSERLLDVVCRERDLLQPLKHLLEDCYELVFDRRRQLLLADERLDELALLGPERVHTPFHRRVGEVVQQRARPLLVHLVKVTIDGDQRLRRRDATGQGLRYGAILAVWADWV